MIKAAQMPDKILKIGCPLNNSVQQPAISVSSTFSAFRHRNYRLWFIGQLVSMIGTWMQSTAQGYLMYQLTGSPAYLGYVGLVSGIPSWMFMIYGGLIADRMSRRTLLIITQSAMMVLAFILAALVFTGLVQWWHILVLAFFLGIANAFDTPARQSFVAELVSREDMTNAIALNGTMFNAGAIIGPAIGGVIYALTGPGWCFTLNGISFVAAIGALAVMRIVVTDAPVRRLGGITAIKEGFEYVLSDRLVATLAFSVLFFNVFGFATITLLPAWAVDVLGGDVRTNGLLLSARGFGAVIGGLTIAAFASRGNRGKMWMVSSFLVPLMFIAFALTRWLPLSLLLLAVIGYGMITVMNNSNAIVQSRVPDLLRGRVMALYSLMFMGGGPIGAAMVGITAEFTSPQLTVILCAFALLAFAAWIWFFRPEVRGHP